MKKIFSYFFSSNLSSTPGRYLQKQEYSVIEINQLLNQRIEENNSLKRQFKYLCDVIQRSNKCSFRFEQDTMSRQMLIVTNHESNKKNIIIYVLFDQLEIVTIYTSQIDDILVISDMILNFVHCDALVGRYFLQELIRQAESLGLSSIMGDFGESPLISFSEKIQFYRRAGFDVTPDIAEGRASIIYKLRNKLL